MSWQLAEVRVEDVVLGGLLGAVVGLFAWPRGATGEMRRTAKVSLDASAIDLESTVRWLTHREAPSSDRQADATFAQYRSEMRSMPDTVDWLPVLGLITEVVRGGQALRRTHGEAGPLPWPGVAGELRDLGQGTADQLRDIGELMIMKTPGSSAATTAADGSVNAWMSTSDAGRVARREPDPAAAVRVLDIWGWLAGVSFDGRRVAANATSAPKSPDRSGT